MSCATEKTTAEHKDIFPLAIGRVLVLSEKDALLESHKINIETRLTNFTVIFVVTHVIDRASQASSREAPR